MMAKKILLEHFQDIIVNSHIISKAKEFIKANNEDRWIVCMISMQDSTINFFLIRFNNKIDHFLYLFEKRETYLQSNISLSYN